MSCPDWRSLTRRRDDEPEAWGQALVHLDGCTRCRPEALAAEPTLVFRRLPAATVDRAEIAGMKQAVAALRRNSRPSRGQALRGLAARRHVWLQAAAVATLVVAAALITGAADRGPMPTGVATPTVTYGPAATPASFAAVEQMPLVEAVDPAFGEVIEVADEDVSLVLVLPPTKDV